MDTKERDTLIAEKREEIKKLEEGELVRREKDGI